MIKIHYAAQLALLTGVQDEQLEVGEHSTVAHLLMALSHRYGEPFSRFFFDAEGKSNRAAMVSVDEEQVLNYETFHLTPSHREILILTPISGG